MIVVEIDKGYDGDPESWEQHDLNAGLAGGILYVLITNKTQPPFLTAHFEHWFEEEEDV